MAFLLDTNIAIHIRDRSPTILRSLIDRDIRPRFSIVTRIELAGGLARDGVDMAVRRVRYIEMVDEFEWLRFDRDEAGQYQRIVGLLGFSRTKILDRMIAAQAIVADATLITINSANFANVPGLSLEIWPAPTR